MFEELVVLMKVIKEFHDVVFKTEEQMELEEKYINYGKIYYGKSSITIAELNTLVSSQLSLYPDLPLRYSPMLFKKIDDYKQEEPYIYLPAQAYIWKEIKENSFDGKSVIYKELFYIYDKVIRNDRIYLDNDIIDFDSLTAYDFKQKAHMNTHVSCSYDDVLSWCEQKNMEMLYEPSIFFSSDSFDERKEKYNEEKNQLIDSMIQTQNNLPDDCPLKLKLKNNNMLIKK